MKRKGYLEACYSAAERATTSRMASNEGKRIMLRQSRQRTQSHAMKRVSTTDPRCVGGHPHRAFPLAAARRWPWRPLNYSVVG